MSKTKIAYGQVSTDSLDVEKSVQYDSSDGNDVAVATPKESPDAWIYHHFNVETVRVVWWVLALGNILIGMILTYAFSDMDVTGTDTPIYKVFGAVNSCVFIDYPPATYVSPVVWAFATITAFLLVILSIARIDVAYKQNPELMSKYGLVLYKVVCWLFMLSILVFSLSEAVQPDMYDPVTVSVHTGAYIFLLFAMPLFHFAEVYYWQHVIWRSEPRAVKIILVVTSVISLIAFWFGKMSTIMYKIDNFKFCFLRRNVMDKNFKF